MITKYFLAEGTVHKNYLLVAALNEDPWEIVSVSFYFPTDHTITTCFFQLNNLPSPTVEARDTQTIENKEELKIAWRYENLSMGDSSDKAGNIFDLSVPCVLSESQKANVKVWDGENVANEGKTTGRYYYHTESINS